MTLIRDFFQKRTKNVIFCDNTAWASSMAQNCLMLALDQWAILIVIALDINSVFFLFCFL